MASWDTWPTLQQNYCKSSHGTVYPSKSFSINGDKPVSYHISWQFVPRKVLHIFMLGVDDFSQFAPVHRLLKHPHFHSLVKFRILGCVVSHYFGNSRTPADSKVRGQQQLCIKYDESPTLFDNVICKWQSYQKGNRTILSLALLSYCYQRPKIVWCVGLLSAGSFQTCSSGLTTAASPAVTRLTPPQKKTRQTCARTLYIYTPKMVATWGLNVTGVEAFVGQSSAGKNSE